MPQPASLRAGHAKAQTVCTLRPRHCGKLELTLTALRVYDMFGLVGAKKPVGLTAPSLVLPDVWPVELSVSERQSPDMDSSEYSMYHPGNDPSETFALREYLSGDPDQKHSLEAVGKDGSPAGAPAGPAGEQFHSAGAGQHR